jgi:hypothetical protein
MIEQPQLDETSPEAQAAIAALGFALAGCHRELVAVPDLEGRRRMRLSDGCWEELRSAVSKYTRSAKSAGAYPERVIIRIKQIASEHAPKLDRDSPIREAIIRLSLESYFEIDR